MKELIANFLANPVKENIIEVFNYANTANFEDQQEFDDAFFLVNSCFRIGRNIAEFATKTPEWIVFHDNVNNSKFFKSDDYYTKHEEKDKNFLASMGYRYDYTVGYTKIEED